MSEDFTPVTSNPASSKARTRGSRNAENARRMAEERVATAQRIASAVTEYHVAADRIDAAHKELSDAGADRLAALVTLRACGLSVADISGLSGLSSSRIQNLVKGESA
jgi:fructose-1,6-bisphosphatase/inositol monophosphatase family enzyme